LVGRLLAALPKNRPQTAADVQVALGDLLPAGFHGDRELSELIGHLYSVDRDRKMLAAEIATAERALAEESSEGKRPPSVEPPAGRGGRKAMLAVGAAALLVATGVISWIRHKPEAQPPAPKPAAAIATAPATSPAPAAAPTTVVALPREVAPPVESPPQRPRMPPSAGRKAHPAAPVAAQPPAPNADAMLDRAEASFDRGDLDGALALARAAGKARPSARAHLMAGRVLLSDGKLADAEVELTEAVRLAPPEDHTALQLLERVRARLRRGAP
jgi:hypothetical protein